MDMTILFILRLLAVVYLAVGVGMLVSGDHYRKYLSRVTGNHGFMYLGGIISLVTGFSIVTFLSSWTGISILITLFGWIALAKGVLVLAFPEHTLRMSEAIVTRKNFKFYAALAIILGLVFAYFGFLA